MGFSWALTKILHWLLQRARLEYNLEELWGKENSTRYGPEREKPDASVLLDDRPSHAGEMAVGTIIRGAGAHPRRWGVLAL